MAEPKRTMSIIGLEPAFQANLEYPEGTGPTAVNDWQKRSEAHRKFNYELCRSIDITKLGVTLAAMVKAGRLDEGLAFLYLNQAKALLSVLRSENNRSYYEGRAEP